MMKKRIYTKHSSVKIKHLLESLIAKKIPSEYRKAMFEVGMELGQKIINNSPGCKYFYLVCTVEDADFLAKGIMQSFHMNNIAFNLACFWNSREKTKNSVRISPVIRRYVEPYSPPGKHKGQMVIVKSLISGACVVKTNIKEVIDNMNPQKIIVTAPVIHTDATMKLENEFEPEIAKMFNYIYFATDSTKTPKGEVQPGIGDVYKRLGLRNQTTKNKYTPTIIQERRTAYL